MSKKQNMVLFIGGMLNYHHKGVWYMFNQNHTVAYNTDMHRAAMVLVYAGYMKITANGRDLQGRSTSTFQFAQ